MSLPRLGKMMLGAECLTKNWLELHQIVSSSSVKNYPSLPPPLPSEMEDEKEKGGGQEEGIRTAQEVQLWSSLMVPVPAPLIPHGVGKFGKCWELKPCRGFTAGLCRGDFSFLCSHGCLSASLTHPSWGEMQNSALPPVPGATGSAPWLLLTHVKIYRNNHGKYLAWLSPPQNTIKYISQLCFV